MASPESGAPGSIVRRLMRAVDRGTLATLLDGTWPYASLVLVALDAGAAPLLLISELAEHTKNLRRDPHASLLFDGTAGLAEPLTGARVTVLGAVALVADETIRARALARYIARHPEAAAYSGFHDFRLWRLEPERAHLVAGFGRIDWLAADAFRPPAAAAAALAAAEDGILRHMNRDHQAALDLYAGRLLGLSGQGWRLTGVDLDGADLRLDAAVVRLEFAAPAADAEDVRREFVRLAQLARGEAPPA